MASAAREYRYAHREFSTNGNLARDLDWAVRERELEHAGSMTAMRSRLFLRSIAGNRHWCGSTSRCRC